MLDFSLVPKHVSRKSAWIVPDMWSSRSKVFESNTTDIVCRLIPKDKNDHRSNTSPIRGPRSSSLAQMHQSPRILMVNEMGSVGLQGGYSLRRHVDPTRSCEQGQHVFKTRRKGAPVLVSSMIRRSYSRARKGICKRDKSGGHSLSAERDAP